MSIYRVRVELTGADVVGGGLSTFFFDGATGTAQQAATAVGVLYDALDNQMSTTVVWRTLPEVYVLNEIDGAVMDIIPVSTQSGTGQGASAILPRQVQGLIQMRTGSIISGRQLRGRIFVPGPTVGSQTDGNPSAAYIAALNAATATLIGTANADWVVWSRTHGTKSAVTSAGTWSKWASLNSRRD